MIQFKRREIDTEHSTQSIDDDIYTHITREYNNSIDNNNNVGSIYYSLQYMLHSAYYILYTTYYITTYKELDSHRHSSFISG